MVSHAKQPPPEDESYTALETPEECQRYAEETVRALLDLSLEEAFERQERGEYRGTIADNQLEVLRRMLAR